MPRRASPRRASSRSSTGGRRTATRASRSSSRSRRFASPANGWNARVGIENRSSVGWELDPGATPEGAFGLQLFETGDAKELEHRNKSGTLPAVRPATRFQPQLLPILEPKASWNGRISAPGPLVAGSWARVVFGTLIAVGKPPEGLGEMVVWITDMAYRLRA